MVRIRPLNDREKRDGSKSCILLDDISYFINIYFSLVFINKFDFLYISPNKIILDTKPN
jgi:hypothetical protein